jgi:sulfur carrier protein ThiS
MVVFVEADDISSEEPLRRWQLEDVHNVAGVFERLGPVQTGGLAILVNGRLANWRTELQDGDVVRLLRAPGGG